MNTLDMLIIGTMVFFIVRGIWRGFFREIGSLTGVVLGIWLANRLQPQMTLILRSYMPSAHFLPLVSFAAIFFLVLVACNLGGWALKTIVKKAFLGWADRALGAGLAVLKGVVLTYLVIVLLTFFVPAKTPLIARSRLAPFIISSYQSMAGFISEGAYARWKKNWFGGQKKPKDIPSKPSEKTF
ncbi:MAG: CvpA family protein [Desulfatiglandaceae bacterium]